LVGSLSRACGQEKKDKTTPQAGIKSEEQMHQEAERVVRAIDLEIFRDGKWTKVERIEKPLLFYSEPTRNNDRGSVWGWAQEGRPVALLELWQNMDNRTRWFFAICNTSGRKLRARRSSAPWWHENDSASQLKDVPGAAAPSAEAPVRQRQLKLLAQKFTAHEFWNPGNSRYELRQLKRPLYTYRDEAGGILDGGLFVFANGTNPEIPLFVEARVDLKDRSKRIWQYTVGRSSHAELHLEYDGKEVFEAPRGHRVSALDQPYWLSFINAALDADPPKP
jgi:hypothetical protein